MRGPDSEWAVYGGIPAFITDQLEPGTVIAFTMIYEPTEDGMDRYRISAVKVVGIASDEGTPGSQLPGVRGHLGGPES